MASAKDEKSLRRVKRTSVQESSLLGSNFTYDLQCPYRNQTFLYIGNVKDNSYPQCTKLYNKQQTIYLWIWGSFHKDPIVTLVLYR